MLDNLPDNHDHGHLFAILSKIDRFGECVEVGSHRGTWTKVLGDKFGKIVTFEPNPEFKADHAVAISNHHGTVYMRHGSENTGQYHISLEGRLTPCRTLDSYDLNPDFIKFDVEGHEYMALEGAVETIKRTKPFIMVELNGLSKRYGKTDQDVKDFLENLGYEEIGHWNKDYLFAWSDKEQSLTKGI